mgnify:CR=1 FL=1
MRHILVRALIAHFCERAGYGGPIRVYLSAQRYEAARRRRGLGTEDSVADQDMACVLVGRRPVFYMNVGVHKTIRQLVDSCAHEVVHLVRPEMRHGTEFRELVRRLVRGDAL